MKSVVKSAWLDGRLQANVALFYNVIHNYQVERTSSNLLDLVVVQRPTSNRAWAELELIGKPVDGLELSATLGATDCVFDRFTDPETGVNQTGHHPPYVPAFHRDAGGAGKTPVRPVCADGICGEWPNVFSTSQTRTFWRNPATACSMHVSGTRRSTGRFVSLANNLTDTAYFTSKVSDLHAGVPGAPQTVGVMASVNY